MPDVEGQDALKRTQLIIGALLVFLGIAFLLLQWVDIDLVALWWPAFIVVPGLSLLAVGLSTGERGAFLAIPGMVLTTVGLLLAAQNATGLWETWAYVWPLVGPGAVGVGLGIFGTRAGKPNVAGVGWRLALAGLVLTIVLGLFFELVVGLSGPVGPWIGRIVWPVLLITAGIWLMLPRRRRG